MEWHQYKNWVPQKLQRDHQGWKLQWLYTGNLPFTEPFFEDTVSQCKTLPENLGAAYMQSDLALLRQQPLPAVAPAAWIFHISRCGSTLLAQLLSLQQQNVVLSEVPVFDQLLRLHTEHKTASAEEAGALMKGALHWYSQRRLGPEQHVIVKSDAWHFFSAATIRQQFPGLPFVLLYRHPYEVFRSHQKRRGSHMVPSLLPISVCGIDGSLWYHDFDGFTAKLLAAYLKAMLELAHNDDQVLLVNYNQGFRDITAAAVKLAGLSLDAAWQQAMEARLLFHAKNPKEKFEGEPAYDAIPDLLQECMHYYQQLESLRITKAGG